MFWVWLMALITIFLLGWFAYKLFSGGTPKLVVSGGDHGHGHSDDGSSEGHSNAHSEANSDSHSDEKSESSQQSLPEKQASRVDSTVAASAGAAAVIGATAASTAASSNTGGKPGPHTSNNPIVFENVASGADINGSGTGLTGHANGVAQAVSSEDASSVREMIKILNLRSSDASRLDIDTAQFDSLWQGNSEGVDPALLSSVRSRLMHMMS